jgi:predicted nucleic acid-binding protein
MESSSLTIHACTEFGTERSNRVSGRKTAQFARKPCVKYHRGVCKRHCCIHKYLYRNSLGGLSLQVLQEFYANVTRKISTPLPKDSARLVVSSYGIWCTETGLREITAAFRIEDESRISFWDALIVSTAVKSGATRILSEDLNPGQRVAGIPIENPFAGFGRGIQ